MDLDHRRTVHTAFAAQSDVTVIWQGWIDLAARDVTDQEAVVQHLIDRRLRAPHGAPSPSSRQLARTLDPPGPKNSARAHEHRVYAVRRASFEASRLKRRVRHAWRTWFHCIGSLRPCQTVASRSRDRRDALLRSRFGASDLLRAVQGCGSAPPAVVPAACGTAAFCGLTPGCKPHALRWPLEVPGVGGPISRT